MKTIFHLDLDAFFVSVERILDPSLKNKPVIVGADPHGRGVVSACSYEARKFGVHSAMPIRTAYKLCPTGMFVRGHYQEYVRYSKAVKDILEVYAPILEQASVDEFYMDFTGTEKTYGNFFNFASKLQKEIHEKLSLPCSIGIGTNKTIAKIASDYNKPKGITYVLPGKEREFLSDLPVETIPGVGKVSLRELNHRGIYKVGDILKMPEEYFFLAFRKSGVDLHRKANGHGEENLSVWTEQKSISKETTFGADILDQEFLTKTLFELSGQVCQTLRDSGLIASTISIKLRYTDFQTLIRSKTVSPTIDDKVVFDTASYLLEKAHTRRVAIRLVGISLTKFTHYFEEESLFKSDTKRDRMLDAINNIRNKFGSEVIQIGKM